RSEARSRSTPAYQTRRRRTASLARQRLPDACEQGVIHHSVSDVDRIGEAFGIGPAVALDHDAVEAEEYSAIGFSWVHFAGERAECVTREQIAELRPYRSGHRAPEILRDLTSGALGGLERDVTSETLGHDHVDYTLADRI